MSSHACSPGDPAADVQHQQVTQSSILLLLQEATNLAPPADDESVRASAALRGGNQDVNSLVRSGPKDSEFTGSFSVMRESERSSAWEVMRLINQQCERLLQSGAQVDLDSSDLAETLMLSRPPECPAVSSCSVPSSASFSAEVVYSFEPVVDVEESGDLAELIQTNMSDVSTGEKCLTENMPFESRVEGCSDQGESVVLSTGSDFPLDFTSCLVSDGDAESAWLPLNASSSQPADLNNNLTESVSKEIRDLQDARRRTQRKQPRPSRSPDPQDPDVQGVTFSMYPELDGGSDRSRLIITSNYSEEIRRLRRSKSSQYKSLQTSQRICWSEEESDSCALSGSKICASCCTRKTPLWRDAEDGTPLCNACGIRYKKYRVRCQQCWNIPKKDANTSLKCLKCGDVLKLKCSSW